MPGKKIEKPGPRPCRHTHQSTGRFLTAFVWCRRPEEIGYCWDCGSLKRDNKTWQYTAREERIRKNWNKLALSPRAKKAGRR